MYKFRVPLKLGYKLFDKNYNSKLCIKVICTSYYDIPKMKSYCGKRNIPQTVSLRLSETGFLYRPVGSNRPGPVPVYRSDSSGNW
jgi:hypothetical protein